MNPFKAAKYQLYLLQLENYELVRFWKLLFKRGAYNYKQLRKNLVWTAKAFAVLFVGELIMLILAAWLFLCLRGANWVIWIAAVASIILFLLFQLVSFIFFTIAVWLLLPLDVYLKNRAVAKAKAKISGLVKLRIVGVAGSYGKTTAKELLKGVLSAKLLVLSTPESVNTPVGIARWVLKNVTAETEVIIVEMGEHYRGDVKEICEIVRPDVVEISGINEAHLERMRTMGTIVQTVFEAVEFSKPEALVVLNADDHNVVENYSKFAKNHPVEFYSSINNPLSHYQAQKIEFSQEGQGLKFTVSDSGENYGEFKVGLLGEYAVGLSVASIIAGKALGLSISDVLAGLITVRPVEHRLQPIKSPGDILIIDDSYNGNPAGVTEAIKVLAKFTGRRKIFITPGLVEMGRAAENVHVNIGRQLAGVADVVILVRDSVTAYIEQGIQSAKGQGLRAKGPEIVWFNTAPEAHEGLKRILKPNDVVLFQNDWGDQYI